MNNPNPFIPQGSLLEQHKRRSRMKLAVFCVVAASVASLTAMLIEGCKREESENPPVDTNQVATVDTNAQSLEASNPPVVVPPISTNAPVVVPPPNVVTPPPEAPEASAGSTYVVVKGDTLGKIAKANGVSVRALESANPDVQPTRLKIGQKLNIPAGSSGGSATTESSGTADMSGAEVYVVKSGDTLSRIAHSHGTTVKALETENNLSTTKIKVGQKLKIPAGAESNAVPVAAAPAPAPAPMPATPPTAAPAAPAPAGNGQ
jgi:LysM repeat protein